MAEQLSREDVTDILTCVGEVVHAVKRLYARQEGIGHGSAIVLVGLFRCGPQRPSDLARICDLDLSTVSRYAQIQEEAGRLVKVAHPADRRAHRLALTDAGIEHVDALCEVRTARLAALIAHWSAHDARALANLASRLAADLVGHTAPLTMPALEHVRATHEAVLIETLMKKEHSSVLLT